MMPNDYSPWAAVYQQTRRWLQSGCFEAMVFDLRSIIRAAQRRSAVILDGRTLQSSCESGPRTGCFFKISTSPCSCLFSASSVANALLLGGQRLADAGAPYSLFISLG